MSLSSSSWIWLSPGDDNQKLRQVNASERWVPVFKRQKKVTEKAIEEESDDDSHYGYYECLQGEWNGGDIVFVMAQYETQAHEATIQQEKAKEEPLGEAQVPAAHAPVRGIDRCAENAEALREGLSRWRLVADWKLQIQGHVLNFAAMTIPFDTDS